MAKTENEGLSSRAALLELLLAGGGGVTSSSLLTQELGMSRQGVFKLICALKEEGLPIESLPQKGYLLGDIEKTDTLSPTFIEHCLKAVPGFNRCIYLKETESTQLVLKKLAQQEAPGGIIAVTDNQTGGRGRRGRSWQSPPGVNLAFSILLRPKLRPDEVQLLNLAAGMAVKEAVASVVKIKAELKWPNDVLCGGRKLCGILSEAAGESDRIYHAITGIGINVNMKEEDMPQAVAALATSCIIESGRTTARWLLLTETVRRFSELMNMLSEKGGAAALISLFRRECDTLGREVRVIQDDEGFTGRAIDVTPEGALRVLTGGEEKIFAAADVHHLRMA